MHVDKDDLEGASVRSLLIGVDAVGETSVPDDMEFGDVAKKPSSGRLRGPQRPRYGPVLFAPKVRTV